MLNFSGKDNARPISEHIKNILEICRLALIKEDQVLNDFGYCFCDVYKEAHFLSVFQHALRKSKYATILEDSDTSGNGGKNVRNDMMIWCRERFKDPITFELKMIWASDRHDKIKSFIKDIEKMNEADSKSAYICSAIYLYNDDYEKTHRHVSTIDILNKEYSEMIGQLNIRHKIKSFEGSTHGYDFPITCLADGDGAKVDRWDRCRLIYCAKSSY